MSNCILCGSKAVVNQQDSASRVIYNCPLCGVFVVSDLAEKAVKRQDMKVSAFMINRKLRGLNDIVFISYENNQANKDYMQVTLEQILEQLPDTFTGQLEGALENLALKSSFPGDKIRIDRQEFAGMFYVYHHGIAPFLFAIDALSEHGWIKAEFQAPASFPCTITITPNGWRHLERARVAVDSDREEVFFSISETKVPDRFPKELAKLCKSCGLTMVNTRMMQPEGGAGNQSIAQVKAAKMVVCDLSDGSGERYYLAGMAKAMGKPCILTCRESSRETLGINSEEISVLFWDTAETLLEKLAQAIQAMA